MNLKIKFELEETELNGEIENLISSSSGGSLPSGGTTGQVLAKNSNANGDAGWKDTEHDLFNANGKTYEEVIYAYESGKVCYLTYAGTKLLNNGYSGNRNPFKFSGENSNGEILTATLSYDNTLTFGDRGDYQITTASQTLSKEKQSQALANIGGLSKNQGTANSGKFLGIGADGIVVPTEVGGGSEWRKIKDLSVTSEAGVTSISITEDQDGNSFSLDEVFILIKSETKQYAYAPIMIPDGSQSEIVGEYRLTNETESSPGVIRIRSFGPFWIATYMKGGYQKNTVDDNWGFYYRKSQPLLSEIPKITGISIGFSTINAEVWGR